MRPGGAWAGTTPKLHIRVGDAATGYAIDSQRSADALERVIGIDWSDPLSHDGYGTYDRFGHALHQSCLAHALRRVWSGRRVPPTGRARSRAS